MQQRQLAIGGAAVLLAVAAASSLPLLRERAPQTAPAQLITLRESAPGGIENCMRAAELQYDIAWAAACYVAGDESNECTLPDARAAVINQRLQHDEARCLAGAPR